MGSKLLVLISAVFLSVVSAAQVRPTAVRPSFVFSAGGGMDYWSGDWERGDINRWGPAAWGTWNVWRGLGINAEGHSMMWGGNKPAQHYKYYVGEGGLFFIDDHWLSDLLELPSNVVQPFVKAELGFGSLSQPGNGTLQYQYTSNTWALGGGVEIRNRRWLWTRVDYTYDGFPHFHSSITNQYHTLNPRGITFGETVRF
jgi:hypothetical protein